MNQRLQGNPNVQSKLMMSDRNPIYSTPSFMQRQLALPWSHEGSRYMQSQNDEGGCRQAMASIFHQLSWSSMAFSLGLSWASESSVFAACSWYSTVFQPLCHLSWEGCRSGWPLRSSSARGWS
ncbi:uncharacterized protein LOC119731331 [Patiria miniata]|uniref:Uncharacterized protein n=1 Tax=Patiria miniata TaxID=46514 RepID=A0A914AAG0_PATMI|nr:uncharacterized protein LOC119731331 [Patiria miniata]